MLARCHPCYDDRSVGLSNLSRRTVLLGGLGLATAAGVGAWRVLRQPSGREVGPTTSDEGIRGRHLLVSPQKGWDGIPTSVGVLDQATGASRTVPTTFLAHSVAGDPANRRRVVAFGQRPARRSAVIDLADGVVTRVLEAVPGHHFYGHGLFSADGRWLFATENEIEGGRGVITVRDTSSWQVTERFPSHGVGPHDVVAVDGGRTLVIANGGLVEDPGLPDTDYRDMAPSLVWVEAASGKLLDRYAPEDSQLSVRHLAATPEGHVAAGLNRFGPSRQSPVVLVREAGQPVSALSTPPELMLRMGGTLSLCLDPASMVVAVTTNGVANLTTFWSVRERRFLASLDVEAASGVGLDPGGEHFVVSTEGGRFRRVRVDGLVRGQVSEAPAGPPWTDARGLNWRHMTAWRA